MKTLVTYSSRTGNTKKVAEAVASVFNDVELKDISEVESLDYDLIVVGTWIDKGTADAKAMKFIETIKGKNTGFFFTLGAYPDSQHAIDSSIAIKELFTVNDNKVLASFHCHGAIDPKLTEWMSKLPADHPHAPNEERKKKWAIASEHPNEDDFKAAKEVFSKIG